MYLRVCQMANTQLLPVGIKKWPYFFSRNELIHAGLSLIVGSLREKLVCDANGYWFQVCLEIQN